LAFGGFHLPAVSHNTKRAKILDTPELLGGAVLDTPGWLGKSRQKPQKITTYTQKITTYTHTTKVLEDFRQ
jgi:hypothetical protein